MKRWMTLFLIVLAAATVLYAQSIPGTLVQFSPTKLDPTTNFSTNVASNTTLTITPPSGQFVYLTAFEVQNCAGTVVTGATPTTITSTGFGGGVTPVWTIGSNATAGLCQPAVTSSYYFPLKSNSPGAAVTFVLPTFATQQTIRENVWYYFAP